MLSIAAIVLLAATSPIDSEDLTLSSEEIDASEMELVLEEQMESDLQTAEIGFDDSFLSDEDVRLLELEE